MSHGDITARGGALKALGRAKLQRIKAQSSVNLTIEALAAKLDKEKDLYVDTTSEQLLHKCEMGARNGGPNSAPAAAAPSMSMDDIPIFATGLTKEEVFSLSSKPGALKKILLDFDGHTTTNSKWNIKGQPPIISPPWDTDGNPDSFSETELGQLKAIWSIVAEDYAPFDVDVTLKDPGDAALLGIGVRVVIGGDSPGGVGMGGTAWVGSFGTNNPAFVYPYRFYSSVKGTGEAASHEAGHTLGLLHDDNMPDGNNWAPIMASSRQFNLTMWSKGEYVGASNKQVDFDVMGQFLDLLPQQYGRSTGAATPLSSASSIAGVISNQGQVDFFSFKANAGDISITAMGAGTITVDSAVYNIGDLDIELSLYDPAGNLLQTVNPPGIADGLGAKISANLPAAGTYFVSVKGVGAGEPSMYGYSNYGSRGRYVLSVGDPRMPTGDPIDCVGGWDCTKCNTRCGGGSRTCTFRVVDPGQEGGLPCRFSSGFVKAVQCNMQGCPARSMRLINLKLDKQKLSGGRVRCRAAAVIKTAAGEALQGVNIIGRWSGDQAMAAAGDVSSVTSKVGIALFNSRPVNGHTCTFTMASAARDGYTLAETQVQMTTTVSW
ncbi:hypothetical protein OEZ86_012639 [Tetradesmus obliquus]|nr:hypothetical protein OEZ86_012639 [Tetradesmus obliquus]